MRSRFEFGILVAQVEGLVCILGWGGRMPRYCLVALGNVGLPRARANSRRKTQPAATETDTGIGEETWIPSEGFCELEKAFRRSALVFARLRKMADR